MLSQDACAFKNKGFYDIKKKEVQFPEADISWVEHLILGISYQHVLQFKC